MNKHLLRTTFVLVLCTLLSSVAALAAGKSKNVTLSDDVTVAGTLVKKGTYKVNFDDQNGELTFKRGSKIVAKTTARREEFKSNSSNPAAYKTKQETEGGAPALTSINIGGAYAVIGTDGGATTGTTMQR